MNSVMYKGIELELPEQKAQFTHSLIMDAIMGTSSNEHIDWTRKLGDVLWGSIKARYPDNFQEASKLFSLLNMNYQICNGGIYQYFDNGYHEARNPYSEHDVARVEITEQKNAFQELVTFAKELFPERVEENKKLDKACKQFQEIWLDEEVEQYETIYSDEEEMIYDEELEEWVDNPLYEEPYEMYIGMGSEIRNDWNFDNNYYKASNYLEELLELKAQYLFKSLENEIHMDKNIDSKIIGAVNGKEVTLEEKIRSAEEKTAARKSVEVENEMQVDR